jgi:DmsE family decaheme c-type cytochrome
MRRLAGGGQNALRFAHQWTGGGGQRARNRFSHRLTALAVAGFVCATLSSISIPARAVEADSDALSALRSYVQLIGTTPSEAAGAPASAQSGNVAALRAFASEIGSTRSLKGATKVAEATSLFDALRQSSEPAAKPMAPARGKKSHEPMAQAKYVGSKVCLGCHSSVDAKFERTLMGRLAKQGKLQCETCHGPASEHVRLGGGRGVGGIISFRPQDLSRTPEENNAICLGCHEHGARTLWQGSIHQMRGLMCTNCHTIMKAVSRKYQLKTAAQIDTCFQCHKDIRAKLNRSEHMPVVEGKMACTNCHNPHGSYTEHLLKQATVNDVCFQCHADKRGPWLWEHPPVVENCMNCHDPHGSINDNMLLVSRPRLCQRCHNANTRHPANPRNPMQIQAVNFGCVNCHSQIHGSNDPAGFAFLR